MELKKLKQLAAVCRKAGIKSFKSPEFEFTLSEDQPVSRKHHKMSTSANEALIEASQIETDSLSDEALLLWSVNTDFEAPV